jgi:hypothetical protein
VRDGVVHGPAGGGRHRLAESDIPPVMHQVWCDADEMRRAMLGD